MPGPKEPSAAGPSAPRASRAPSAAPSAPPAPAMPPKGEWSREGWDILDVYFRDHRYPFTRHHLDSFREFLRTHIPNTIRAYNPITMVKTATPENPPIRVQVYVGGEKGDQVFIDRPVIYDNQNEPMLLMPQEARLRNLTYQTNLYADVTIVYTKEDGAEVRREFPRVLLAILPIMVHSDACSLHGQGTPVLRQLGECPYDAGGYFIIDGKEKVLVSQESDAINRLVVSKVKDDLAFSHRGVLRCCAETGESSLLPRTVQMLVVRRYDPGVADLHKPPHPYGPDQDVGQRDDPDAEWYDKAAGDRMTAHPATAKVPKKYRAFQGAILVSVPSIEGEFPLFVLFRALGLESDREICEAILGTALPRTPGDPNAPASDPSTMRLLEFLRPSMRHAASEKVGVFTTDAAMNYLVGRVHYGTMEQLRGILGTEVFPNVTEPLAKARFLASCVATLARTVLGVLPLTDRDGYTFKRVDISGLLCARLFQENYNLFRKNVRNMLDHEYYYLPYKNNNALEDMVSAENLRKVFDPLMITTSFQRSFKGMWGDLPYGGDPEQGIVQDLNRISYIGYLSHVRRVNLPLDRSIKITSPHRLHPQQWGRMCPFESPDGASIGYLKNLALLAQITSGTPTAPIRECLDELGYIPHSQLSAAGAASRDLSRIFLNGDFVGATDRPLFLLRALRAYRRNGLFNPFTSLSFDYTSQELRILTEAGRPCRPLLILGAPIVPPTAIPGKKWFHMVYGTLLPEKYMNEDHYYFQGFLSPYTLPQISNLVSPSPERVIEELERSGGFIEYLDADEENNALVWLAPSGASTAPSAPTRYHTHAEIHPATMFSVVTNNIPFANHNFAPRNCFYGSQSKQAIGVYATNFSRRFDTAAYIQHYPQRPLVTTRPAHYNANDRMPNGFNAIVAVMTYGGFNQEDSIMINRAAIDRGLFQITAYKTLSATEKVLSTRERTEFANPVALRDAGHPVAGIRHATYDLLDENGFVAENAYVPRGREAAVIGMVHVSNTVQHVQQGVLTDAQVVSSYRDVSHMTDIKHYGRVDSVYVGNKGGADMQRTCKVRFRRVRRPELGDKAVSRSAQKGVIGMILAPEDMPFTKDGVVPDLIINPHAFPSRMTIGHLVETILAKACCLEGTIGDATVFIPIDTEALFGSLEERHRFERHGNEILYNGKTGEMVPSEVFIGPTFYMRLKHMVTDKIHAAGVAPKTLLTHQPASGRSKGGGMRLGEMERDVVLGHGMAQFTKESMMEKADKSTWTVCRYCGILTDTRYTCQRCSRQNLATIQTPYALKQLSQELQALGIDMLFSTQPLSASAAQEAEEESVEELAAAQAAEAFVPPPSAAPALPSAPPESAAPPSQEGGAKDPEKEKAERTHGTVVVGSLLHAMVPEAYQDSPSAAKDDESLLGPEPGSSGQDLFEDQEQMEDGPLSPSEEMLEPLRDIRLTEPVTVSPLESAPLPFAPATDASPAPDSSYMGGSGAAGGEEEAGAVKVITIVPRGMREPSARGGAAENETDAGAEDSWDRDFFDE